MAGTVDDDVRAELRRWLGRQLHLAPDVVVKDPRACWVPDLWAETAEELAARIGFLTMLRAPAEVVRSRQTYYRANRPHMDAYGFAVMGLAGWVNANLVTERLTRGRRRVLVRYDDLRSDWRSTMHGVREDLGLRFNHPLGDAPHAEVDAFVEPGLNRHQATWEGLDLPPELVGIAEEVFAQLSLLADRPEDDRAATAALDEIAGRYADLYRRSQAIAVDAATARARAARRQALAEARAPETDPARGEASAGPDEPDGRLRRRLGSLRTRVRNRVRPS